MEDVYTKPGYLFRRIQQIAVSIFLEECSAFDLTPVQYAALVAIRTYPGIDVTRLSAVIALDRSTLGSVVERLELKSWIARRSGQEDRRVKLLYLTETGGDLLGDVEKSVKRAQERMLQPLDAADRDILLDLMRRVIEFNNEGSRVRHRPGAVIAHLGKAEIA
jgi:DNA-binding MarR family transcriptional regulator